MNKIGVFGGTFNPVHKGHELTAINFYEKFNLSKLIVIPANIPPHKIVGDSIPAECRLEMCRLAFEKYANYKNYNIEISDIEVKKEGLSYSFDTVKNLRETYPEAQNQIYFLIGSDMFLYLEHWHKYKELLEICVFVVAFRKHEDRAEIAEVLKMRDALIRQGYKIELLNNIPFEISSTEIREKIKSGHFDFKELEEYVSPEVLNYIKERKIYVLQ